MTRAQEFDTLVRGFHELWKESPQDGEAMQIAGQTLMGFILFHWRFLKDAIEIKEAMTQPTAEFIERYGERVLSKESRSIRHELCNSIEALLETVRNEQG